VVGKATAQLSEFLYCGSFAIIFNQEPDISIMTDLNLQEIHDFAVDLAKQAGKMILKASNSRLSSTSSSTAEKLNCPSPPIQI
jgi:hypothetical protein